MSDEAHNIWGAIRSPVTTPLNGFYWQHASSHTNLPAQNNVPHTPHTHPIPNNTRHDNPHQPHKQTYTHAHRHTHTNTHTRTHTHTPTAQTNAHTQTHTHLTTIRPPMMRCTAFGVQAWLRSPNSGHSPATARGTSPLSVLRI
jgi:hypothetical protein